MDDSRALLPPYLNAPAWPPGTEPLARLSRMDGGRWLLEGDPQVAQVTKRLFPGAKSEGQGRASFPDTPRAMLDMTWLMSRFPIAAAGGEENSLAGSMAAAREHAARKVGAAEARAVPAGDLFTGTARLYQEECLGFNLAHRKVLVADDTGLGKTVEAIMLIAAAREFPALVVVPPHLVAQWQQKMDQFLRRGPDGVKIATLTTRGLSKDDVRKGLDRLPDADVILVHYGLVAYWRERLEAAGIRTVVLDEVGELRHRDTAKYNTCSLLTDKATYVAGYSATPIYNYGDEIWSVMNVIDFQCLGGRDDFLREWTTSNGTHMLVTDPEALGATLRREGMMIRRRKHEVASQMPPKHRDVVRIDADSGAFRDAMESAIPLLQGYKEADRSKRFTLTGRIGEMTRRATGIAKAGACAVFLQALLEAGEPVVAFAYHHDVVDSLCDALAAWNPVRRTGRETTAEKEASKQAFLDGKSNLLIVNLRTATGTDGLQHRARLAVFCELDWSPAVHGQAEDRLWRDGQLFPVLCYYLLSSVGSDPDMEAKLGLKVGQAKGIMQDPFDTEEDKENDQAVTQGFVSSMVERLVAEYGGNRARTARQEAA